MITKKVFAIFFFSLILIFIFFLLNGQKKFLLRIKNSYFSSFFEPKPLFSNKNEKNYCINYKSPENLTPDQQFEEFIQGPCSPIIIVPGMMGTSLMIEIECETLKKENPEIFSVCGWETCSDWLFWLSKPNNEYKLWITDFFSPLSFFSVSEKNHKCFNELIKINFNATSQTDETRYASPKGVRITWYGNTTGTKQYSECGSASMRDISGVFHFGCDSEGFGKFFKSFENLGYQNGLSLQAIPYDFRKGVLYNDFGEIFKKALKLMRNLSGKKITVVAHSMGNNHVLHTLNQMLQSEKDEQIYKYIAIGPPLAGTMNALLASLSGFKEFQYLNIFGLDFEAQKSFLSSPSMLECFPYDSFERFQNESWMKEIINRIEEEEKYSILNNSESFTYWNSSNFGLDWFPSPFEKCSNLHKLNKNCSEYFINFLKEPIVKILKENFYAKKDDFLKLIKNFSLVGNDSLEIYDEILKHKLNNLENPNVETIIIFTSFYDTIKKITYKKNPREQTQMQQDFFWDEEISYGKGDGNVLTSSVLVPASKWIWEFKNKKSNAKKIKIIEICSNFNNFEINEEDVYVGQKCSCLEDNQENCKHSCLISENSVIYSIFNIVKNITKNENFQMDKMKNYKDIQEICYILNQI